MLQYTNSVHDSLNTYNSRAGRKGYVQFTIVIQNIPLRWRRGGSGIAADGVVVFSLITMCY